MSTSDLGATTPSNDVVIGIQDPRADLPPLTVDGADPAVASTGDPVLDGNRGSLTWDSLSGIDHTTVVAGCGCAACQGMLAKDELTADQKGGGDPLSANPEGNNIGTLLNLVTNPDGSRSFSGNRNVDAILIGSKWGISELTYSFPTTGSNYNGSVALTDGVDKYHIDLGTLQQAAARASIAQISAATNLRFTEITETDTVHANIRISQTADQGVGSAYGGFPSDTHQPALLRPRREGHMGLRHHDARDRPHHGPEARASGLHEQRPVLLFRHHSALR